MPAFFAPTHGHRRHEPCSSVIFLHHNGHRTALCKRSMYLASASPTIVYAIQLTLCLRQAAHISRPHYRKWHFTVEERHFILIKVPLYDRPSAIFRGTGDTVPSAQATARSCQSRPTETLSPPHVDDDPYFSAKSLAVACFFTIFAPRKDVLCGNSSVGRAQPCQGWGRGFKSRLPLQRRRNGGIGRHEGLKIP